MLLPEPRGPVSHAIVQALSHNDLSLLRLPCDIAPVDPVTDEDVQLALWLCYELHYRGFDDIDPIWEWQPELITVRRALEGQVLGVLRREVKVPQSDKPIPESLRELVEADDGPSLSHYAQRQATAEQLREIVIHRSIYQLKEADPHTWAIPRLYGRVKAALFEIQLDEFGRGDASRMHSELYRRLMQGLGLDDSYGAYIDAAPAVTLAIGNVMSLFGLRSDLRGALVGHLAAYEMTSSVPCRRYAQAMRRLVGSDAACQFYDEHVTADALHEQIAVHDLCGGLARAEPALITDILFGAATGLYIETRFAEHVLGSWQVGQSSLNKGAHHSMAEAARSPD
jgi:hypothetical protein